MATVEKLEARVGAGRKIRVVVQPPLEETPIHYLMSRGIPRNQAELMVIDGFFDELLLRVPFERVRERLKSEIESKIVGTVGAYD